ncbi:ATP-binding cassette domain-containing protein [Agrococcus baldri]|uniref:Daunorubicin resistance protein DrrA family ABC transporter ATP-binding protein n=1 Tax=Agrococcus baldri TaxID=153730 RepID=A0AA87URC3_9MICO|nr:ATP-binding cassette domain-containing protein [Agrococcus baldri]GEK79588.1 daunorubicin resistance protein DrrA family ABC transporter ATP-binding protein [Agrococcus baldri]
MTTPSAIRATGLRKQYGGTAALDGFDLTVPPGAIHGLLGPNGAGKSTAVGILTTLRRADAGEASIAGFDVRRQGAEVRRRIGLVGQAHAVDEILGGRQNLVMFARLAGLAPAAARARADELLERFGLLEAAGKPASQYSGGMRRRLDIAIALLLSPAVLFLDEPTTGLDPRGRAEVWDAVREIADRGTAVLLTTQYLDEADRMAARISVLRRGTVVAEGTPGELKRSIGGDRVEVTPSDPAMFDAAAAAVRTAIGAEATVDRELGVVTAPALDGPAATIAVLRALDEAGIEIADLELRRPTLDDVFLTLTKEAA